jgi:hypothetical protein
MEKIIVFSSIILSPRLGSRRNVIEMEIPDPIKMKEDRDKRSKDVEDTKNMLMNKVMPVVILRILQEHSIDKYTCQIDYNELMSSIKNLNNDERQKLGRLYPRGWDIHVLLPLGYICDFLQRKLSEKSPHYICHYLEDQINIFWGIYPLN